MNRCMCMCVECQSSALPVHLIQHDIVDINDIFRDLGTLVHDQGEVIGK